MNGYAHHEDTKNTKKTGREKELVVVKGFESGDRPLVVNRTEYHPSGN